jgi:hypothetical protein
MSRPYKSGLEYFSFDVDFFEDEKITAIFVEFGIKGEIIAIRLLCAIYRNSYFAKWDVPLKMKIAKSSGLAPDLIDKVVDRLVKWEFFDNTLFNSSNILTSKGIQKRYLESTKRRLDSAITDYCLLNDDNNSVNVDNNPRNDGSNQQSKREREREKKDLKSKCEINEKGIDSPAPKPPDKLSQKFLSRFESEFPQVDHVKEFRKCQDYYLARNTQITDWTSLYHSWLQKDFPKALKPVPKKPPVEFPPESEQATPDQIHAEIAKARKTLIQNTAQA